MPAPIISAVAWTPSGPNSGTLTFTVDQNGGGNITRLELIAVNTPAAAQTLQSLSGTMNNAVGVMVNTGQAAALQSYSWDFVNLPNAQPCFLNKLVRIEAQSLGGLTTFPVSIPLAAGPPFVPTVWDHTPVANGGPYTVGVFPNVYVPGGDNVLPPDPSTYRLEWGTVSGGPYPNVQERWTHGDGTIITCATVPAGVGKPCDTIDSGQGLYVYGYNNTLTFLGLPCNTPIYYRVTGYRNDACTVNGAGTNVGGPFIYSPEATFTTPPGASTASAPVAAWAAGIPTVTSNIAAVGLGGASFRLRWNTGPVATYANIETAQVLTNGASATYSRTLPFVAPGTSLWTQLEITQCDGSITLVNSPVQVSPCVTPDVQLVTTTLAGLNVTVEGQVNANGGPSPTVTFFVAPAAGVYGVPFASTPGPATGSLVWTLESAVETGLIAGTAYKAKIVVDNGCTSVEQEVLFATPGVPACVVPTLITPFNVLAQGGPFGPTSLYNLTWAADFDRQGNAGSAEWFYGTTPGGPYPFNTGFLGFGAGGAQFHNAAAAGFESGTTYYFVDCITSACDGATICLGEFSHTFPPAPATAPSVTDATPADCSTVGSTTMFVQAFVNPEGVATTAFVEYGTTALLGSSTAPIAMGAGTSLVVFSQLITGLVGGTPIFWRIVAQNASGTNRTPISSCTTLPIGPPAPTVVDSSCASVTDSIINTSVTVNPNGLATTVFVEYGTVSGAYGTATVPLAIGAGVVDVVSGIPLTPLVAGTTYFWRAVATNGSGTNVGPEEVCVTDPLVPPPAPQIDIPTLSCTPNATFVDVNFDGDPQGASTDVTIEWGLTPAFGNVTGPVNIGAGIGFVPVGPITLTPIATSTTIFWRGVVTSVNGTNVSPTRSCTTLAAPPPAPAVSCTSAWDVGSTAAILAGLVTTNNLDTTVTFEYDEDPFFGSPVVSAPILVVASVSLNDAISAYVSGLAPLTQYFYRIVATNSAGTNTSFGCTFTTGADLNLADPSTDPSCAEISTVELCHMQSVVVLCDSISGRTIKVHTIYDREGNPIPLGTVDAYGNFIGTRYTDVDDNPLDPLTVGPLVSCDGGTVPAINVVPGILDATGLVVSLDALGASSYTVTVVSGVVLIGGVAVPVGTYSWGINADSGVVFAGGAFAVDASAVGASAFVHWTV